MSRHLPALAAVLAAVLSLASAQEVRGDGLGFERWVRATIEEVRRRALQVKNSPPFTGAVIQVKPKTDERGQRRLQC